MMRATGIALLLIFAACGDSSVPLEEDFSYIEDPHERWQAYRIADYRINQTYGCECLPPYSWSAVVRAGAIVGAVTEENHPGWTKEELDERARSLAWTVEEMFTEIEDARMNACDYQVEYHPKFGYPTFLSIDWYCPTVDDEVTRTLEHLQTL